MIGKGANLTILSITVSILVDGAEEEEEEEEPPPPGGRRRRLLLHAVSLSHLNRASEKWHDGMEEEVNENSNWVISSQ